MSEERIKYKYPTIMNDETFPTGSDLLDLVVGGGQRYGYPAGRIVNIVGDKSSGKTFLACELIAASYYKWREKFRWVYDDAESGFTFNTQDLYGFDVIPADKRYKSRTVEEWACNVRLFLDSLKSDEIGIYVLDTLDGLSSQQIHARSEERFKNFKTKGDATVKGSYQMEAAKFLSQEFFRELTFLVEQKKVLLVIISQVRDKIDSLFNEQTRSGGRALDFYAHTVLWLSTMQKVVKKDRVVGVVVKALTKKSKTPRPFRSCILTLLFDYGVDNVGSNVDFLYDLRTEKGELRSAGEMLRWSDGTKELTPKALVEFIAEKGKGDLFKEHKKLYNLEGVKKITEWIYGEGGLREAFEDAFGIAMKRNELIEWIEKNNKQAQLTAKVRAKWETLEESIRSIRPRKYENLT